MLPIVTARPEMLIGVRGSWKTIPAALMVMTSLNIPQMLKVTTDDRLRSANSAAIMQNASTPGNMRSRIARRRPCSDTRILTPLAVAVGPSTGMAIRKRDTNMIGVRKKSVEKGFDVAGWRSRRICVRAHLKPEKNADAMTRANPTALKAASPATIIITPTVMVVIMMMSFIEGVSSLKRKANRRTKASAEDLHIVRKVREMNFKDMFPRPTSREVAVPQGSSRVA